MQGPSFKTTVSEEEGVVKFCEIMKSCSQEVVNKSFKMSGLEKFKDLKLPEDFDEMETLAEFLAQIDLNFEWATKGKLH